jgi:glycosyltransferase involved in cell wall biosynthesis
VRFLDAIPREQIPWVMRSSHLLFSAEVNPPCPNSVIEALACGLPVIGFDTGSLSEIVQREAGVLAPYGTNSWKLEKPDISALVSAAEEVLEDQPHFRKYAREQAEAKFGLDQMVEEYLRVLL